MRKIIESFKDKTTRPLAEKINSSLSNTIFTNVAVFTCFVVIVLGVLSTFLLYSSYENDLGKRLSGDAVVAGESLMGLSQDDQIEKLDASIPSEVRYTLIASDGTVLHDSSKSASKMGNHISRPEVIQAMAGENAGKAVVARARVSETLTQQTLYAAIQMKDGNIIRVASFHMSMLDFIASMALPMIVMLFLIGMIAFWVSKMLVVKMISPIKKLNLEAPLQNKVYEEIEPLLIDIDKSHKKISDKNKLIAEHDIIRRDFSASVSHELKTPLQVISGYAELLKENLVAKEDRKKFAGRIYKEAQSMRSLIDDVLFLSRLDDESVEEHITNVDLSFTAKNVVERLESVAEKAQLKLELSAQSCTIKGAEALLEVMLYNLVDNAIQYNTAGGSVKVALCKSEDGKLAVLSISDTGIGMTEQACEKVFERFYRVDKSRSKETGGTGLGLAIVKHAVLFHDGDISLESTPGVGSTFTLKFSLTN